METQTPPCTVIPTRPSAKDAAAALLANPGELQGRTGRIGFGVLDTDTRIINLHNLDFYAP